MEHGGYLARRASVTSKQISGTVERVIDGDTIVVRIRVRVRGPNAAELRTQEGQQQAAKLSSTWPPSTRVLLRPAAIDDYQRMVADVDRDTRQH